MISSGTGSKELKCLTILNAALSHAIITQEEAELSRLLLCESLMDAFHFLCLITKLTQEDNNCLCSVISTVTLRTQEHSTGRKNTQTASAQVWKLLTLMASKGHWYPETDIKGVLVLLSSESISSHSA